MKHQMEIIEHILMRSFCVTLAILVAGFFIFSPAIADAQTVFGAHFTSYTEKPNLARGLPLSQGVRDRINKKYKVGATAYSSAPNQTDDSPFLSANQTYVYDGMIAANFLPFGTLVKIPSISETKIFRVDDRMNSRYYKKIDIWMPDRESAIQFGYKNLEIEIVGRQL